MAGQAILGETVLKQATAIEAAAPSVEALATDFTAMVFRIAYSILRNHHDAEDAVQECFLRIVRHRHNLHQVRNFKTWVARIAWTTALDRRRSSHEMVSLNEEEGGVEMQHLLPDLSALPDEQLAGQQMQDLLERLIAGLPEDLRCPLELSTVQELNSAEISEIMEIPEGSVRTRLFRARKQLREKLTALLEKKP